MNTKRIILIGTTVVLFLMIGTACIFLIAIVVNGFSEGYINPLDILVVFLVGAMGLTGLILLRKKISNLIGIS